MENNETVTPTSKGQQQKMSMALRRLTKSQLPQAQGNKDAPSPIIVHTEVVTDTPKVFKNFYTVPVQDQMFSRPGSTPS